MVTPSTAVGPPDDVGGGGVTVPPVDGGVGVTVDPGGVADAAGVDAERVKSSPPPHATSEPVIANKTPTLASVRDMYDLLSFMSAKNIADTV